ncbi:MAG: hypothetical protein K0S29_1033 [Gammaproteobacteria bacterium]|jgi:hypothetical protein|nr:hypothetical protein [Gammaproteobacteria bacterium]
MFNTLRNAAVAFLAVQANAASLRGKETVSCPESLAIDFNSTMPGNPTSVVRLQAGNFTGYSEDTNSCVFPHPSNPADSGTFNGTLYAQTPAFCIYSYTTDIGAGWSLASMTESNAPCAK